uniref:Uncharacterized protein n=1 Tax=Oryza glumipatula TaxID=40148 RepID=A0A0D9Y9W4_9ORYZ
MKLVGSERRQRGGGFGRAIKQQRARLYIIQRCVTNSQDEAWEPKKERRIQQVPEGAKIKTLHHFAMRLA